MNAVKRFESDSLYWIESKLGVGNRTLWCVMGKSPVVKSGIILSEHRTRERAELDLKFWVENH